MADTSRWDNVPVTDYYGENCFSEEKMQKYLSKEAFQQFQQVKHGERYLSSMLASEVAEAMKSWAVEKGATHFTHWFQPLTGLTAEKHDSFLHADRNGKAIMEFSKDELIKGEGDASSLPSGGLRATFEARGYTAWDSSSPAFIKETGGSKILYIPTAFFSFNELALDKKVPLLRSIQAIEKQTIRILKLLGNSNVHKVFVNTGIEQEYFLIEREFYDRRPDLRLSNRTIIGNIAAKGQELNDHYYGAISERVSSFMKELNIELWRLGICSKTQHKEAAPNQFEIAVLFEDANLSIDHNQVVMEVLQEVALRHGLVAILHEKPFKGVNGSGKHNNWSLSTDDGQNLFSPGDNAEENMQFLLFLTCFLKAVDSYQGLLISTVASASNCYRLGGNEAPPAILSVYLGGFLTNLLERFSNNEHCHSDSGQEVKLGIFAIPKLPKDMTDRNRTSPLAFTGNKFEFRMPGSSQSISDSTTVLNTIMAQALEEASDRIESSQDKNNAVAEIIKENYQLHKRIVFNGDSYNNDWSTIEARKRGLDMNEKTVDQIVQCSSEEALSVFEHQNVLSRDELSSRCIINLQTFSKQINIEAAVMSEMIQKGVLPVAEKAISGFFKSIERQKKGGCDVSLQLVNAQDLSCRIEKCFALVSELHLAVAKAQAIKDDDLLQAKAYEDEVKDLLMSIRVESDFLETNIDKEAWPYPSYDDLLFK
ncbi:MAG: glutamine synthetase III [Sphaerochaetaceae bacterium]|nr:glutamine synthetase III [Sphaerochaetaceae bacterium]MDD3162743.1 glutamine synthetase III [Sphaerochaetaceae bacterium]MDD4006963.1 glutamine synthetase III [Sphaerochaetaceae bacterium]MDD4396072.1 glutamine synthetase III [Sphaerochaetaceae bacterium]